MKNKKLREVISQIAASQMDKGGNPFPCPRCGNEMRPILTQNAYSRHEKVYICSDCGKDEFVRSMTGTILPLEEWAFTGMFKLTANDLTARDFEYINDEEHGLELECTFECWFDVDLQFGTKISEYEGDAFINLYAAHNPVTGSLRMFGTAVYPDKEEPFSYEPTAEERTEILIAMEDGCKKDTGLTMAEMYRKAEE